MTLDAHTPCPGCLIHVRAAYAAWRVLLGLLEADASHSFDNARAWNASRRQLEEAETNARLALSQLAPFIEAHLENQDHALSPELGAVRAGRVWNFVCDRCGFGCDEQDVMAEHVYEHQREAIRAQRSAWTPPFRYACDCGFKANEPEAMAAHLEEHKRTRANNAGRGLEPKPVIEHYILDDHGEPVRCDDLMAWAWWFEKGNRRVSEDFDEGDAEKRIRVSTVFLGIDHNFGRDGPPVLWETMVFGGLLDGECDRYSSKEAAVLGHQVMCQRVSETLVKP